jgi:riboflavin synthase
MFTGLVEASAAILSAEARAGGMRLVVRRPSPDFNTRPGDSVAVSGVCLTVVPDPAAGSHLAFDLSAETLSLTWLGESRPGRSVNLERALRLGDRLGGHMVSGHVDGLARVLARNAGADGGLELELEAAPEHARYLTSKGSVTLDGVSLTVVRPRGRLFGVALIPETLARTTLGEAKAGQRLHLEADLVGKWVERLLAER